MKLLSRTIEWASLTGCSLIICAAFVGSSTAIKASPGFDFNCQSDGPNKCACAKDINDPDAEYRCASQINPDCATECECVIDGAGNKFCALPEPDDPVDP